MKKLILIILMMVFFRFVYGFELLSVSPRVFTPGDDVANDRVFFEFVNPDLAIFTLKIYDLRGKLIAELPTGDPGFYNDRYYLFWDGKDNNQKLVEPGIYIYIAQINQKIYSGTIVVAR